MGPSLSAEVVTVRPPRYLLGAGPYHVLLSWPDDGLRLEDALRLRRHSPGRPRTDGTAETGLVAVEELAIPYRIVRSARRRRTLELRVERDGVRVAAPLRTSAEEIAAFVRSRAGWIQKQIEKT